MSNVGAAWWLVLNAVVCVCLVGGCSKGPAETASERGDEEPAVAGASMIGEVDQMCEEILRSPDAVAAAAWLERYPMSAFGADEEGDPILLSLYVRRFEEAGAGRLVIQSAKLGAGEFLLGMIVVLPADAAARQRLFAIEPELSALCVQTPVTDRGQKYLHYSFD